MTAAEKTFIRTADEHVAVATLPDMDGSQAVKLGATVAPHLKHGDLIVCGTKRCRADQTYVVVDDGLSPRRVQSVEGEYGWGELGVAISRHIEDPVAFYRDSPLYEYDQQANVVLIWLGPVEHQGVLGEAAGGRAVAATCATCVEGCHQTCAAVWSCDLPPDEDGEPGEPRADGGGWYYELRNTEPPEQDEPREHSCSQIVLNAKTPFEKLG